MKRSTLAALCLLATCSEPTPAARFEPLDYDYLNKLRLDVETVEIDDSWTPRSPGRHVENDAPNLPRVVLRRMADERLLPGSATGRAIFVIDDASLVRVGDRYDGRFAIHLAVLGPDGAERGSAEVQVRGTRGVSGSGVDAVRADLYALTRKMMDDMNVELEFQVRRSLRDLMQNTTPVVPPPDDVAAQSLKQPKLPPPPPVE